jgi:hypothetical protein
MNKRTCIKYLLSKSIQPTIDTKEFAMRREIEMKEMQSFESGKFAIQSAPKRRTFLIHFPQN